MAFLSFLTLVLSVLSTVHSFSLDLCDQADSPADSQSSPNPIAAAYPQNVTGTLNGTVIVVPIPFSVARSVIPAQYNIITQAYKNLLPGFPEDSYPVS